MGHVHHHHHHSSSHGGLAFRKPRKETKAAALAGLYASAGNPALQLQAIMPLQLESPALFEQLGKLVQAGNGERAVKLLEMCPTRMPTALLALVIVVPVVLASTILGLVLSGAIR